MLLRRCVAASTQETKILHISTSLVKNNFCLKAIIVQKKIVNLQHPITKK